MAAKRKPGRPKGSSKGPSLRRGKLSSARAKRYMDRGLAAALKKGGRKRGTFGKKRGRKSGYKHSAATIAKIKKGMKAAWKRGAYKGRKRRTGGRRRKAA